MLSVLFFSPESDDKELTEILKLLTRCCSVLAVGQNFIRIPDSEPDILLISADSRRINPPPQNCVIMTFSKNSVLPYSMTGCVLLAFEEMPTFKSAPCPCCPLISCGLHLRDTITLSSIENDRAVLSIQREFCSINGNIIEIGEHPLIYSGKNHRALIASAALMLLCGKPLSLDTFEPPRENLPFFG